MALVTLSITAKNVISGPHSIDATLANNVITLTTNGITRSVQLAATDAWRVSFDGGTSYFPVPAYTPFIIDAVASPLVVNVAAVASTTAISILVM